MNRRDDSTRHTDGQPGGTHRTEDTDGTHSTDGTHYVEETRYGEGVHRTGTTGSGATGAESLGRVPTSDDRRGEAEAREKFGGLNLGAAFFGWLVAIAVAILLVSVIGAVLTAVGSSAEITQTEAERSAGKIGVGAGITLLVVLALAYYTGGYVAGRMSRFDGARQGLGVWVIGLLVTLLALALGAIFGSQYNLLDRVDLPRLPISTDELGWGGLLTALAVVVLTALAAVLGGVVGHRYHDRVDRAARR